jgi:hypothetical protein
MVFQSLDWAWVHMPSTKDFIVEAVPAARVAVKRNEAVRTRFRILLAKLGLLFGMLCLECMIIRMLISAKE